MAVLDLGKVVPEKGVDYFTQNDINGFINDVKNEIKVSDLQNDAGYITKDANDLTYYYTKTEVDGKVSSVYKYKGSVATYSDLPNTGMTIGDVYNVESDGSNYAWNGTSWDKLGGDIDLSGYQTKIDSNNKLSANLVDDTNTTEKFTNTTEKSAWNAKYDKPTNGIPKSDLSTEVQNSLGKADTAIQDVSNKQDTLVSGTNIKTINNQDILGSGNVTINGGQTIQYDTMPTASIDNLGQIIQYTGATNSTYINGYFYKCVSDGQATPTYSWQNVEVQKSSIPKYYIDGDYLYYRITTGNYDLAVNSIGSSATSLPLTELTEAVQLSVDNNKYLALIIPTKKEQTYYYYYATSKPSTVGTSTLNLYSKTMKNQGIWNAILELNLQYSNNTYTCTNNHRMGNTIIALGVNNTSNYTPNPGTYNPATAIYAESMLASVAPLYSTSSTYAVGDYVCFNGKLYVCNTTISSGESWNPNHWTETTAMSVVGNISTVLESLVTVEESE